LAVWNGNQGDARRRLYEGKAKHMRERLTQWVATLVIFFGVPLGFIWLCMPYLDMSHATYLSAQGDYPRALRTLNRAIRFNSGIASIYSRRGWVFEKMGDYGRALTDFNRSIDLNDANWEPYNNRAWVYTEMNQSEASLKVAWKDANRAIELCADCPAPYDTRGLIELRLKQTDKALEDFSRAIELDTRFGEAYFHRSLCYKQMNQPERARQDRMRAHEFGYYRDSEPSVLLVPGMDKSGSAVAAPSGA
jgi:tetratricopeptide (TPR) repeat protein